MDVLTTDLTPDSLYSGISRLSSQPDNPFLTWVLPGCQFQYIECWQFPSARRTICKYGPLSDADASNWLRQKQPTLNGGEAVAGIKVLIVDGTARPDGSDRTLVDVSREAAILTEAVNSFHLAPSMLNLFSLNQNAPMSTDLLKMHPTLCQSPTMLLQFPYQNLVWTRNKDTSCTYAILCADDIRYKVTEHLAYWLQRYEWHTDLPMLLPYLASFIAVDHQGSMIEENLREIRVIEMQSGVNVWTEGPPARPVTSAEYTGLSSKASGIAASSSSRKTDALQLQCVLQSIATENAAESVQFCTGTAIYADKVSQLTGCIGILKGILASQVLFCEEIKNRAMVQQSALFNLIAQQDQLLNLQVARDSRIIALESKKDSSSMKTIAVMTMVFLPGTFIAVCFRNLRMHI